MKFKPSPRFAQGFLLPDGRSARRTLVGRLFPQPNVLLDDDTSIALDDVLGQGFSIVMRGVPGDADMLGLSEIDWGGIQPKGVIVAPRDDSAAAPEGITVVRESDAQDWPTIPVGHVFVLRPDRYVAACMPLEQWHRRRAEIVSLIDATFRTSAAPRRSGPKQKAVMRTAHVALCN